MNRFVQARFHKQQARRCRPLINHQTPPVKRPIELIGTTLQAKDPIVGAGIVRASYFSLSYSEREPPNITGVELVSLRRYVHIPLQLRKLAGFSFVQPRPR